MLKFNVSMKNDIKPFAFSFEDFQTTTKIDAEHYKGSYEVTPKAESQSLETKDKFMDNNVTINKMPFFETSNEQGGETIYIGDEITYGN